MVEYRLDGGGTGKGLRHSRKLLLQKHLILPAAGEERVPKPKPVKTEAYPNTFPAPESISYNKFLSQRYDEVCFSFCCAGNTHDRHIFSGLSYQM